MVFVTNLEIRKYSILYYTVYIYMYIYRCILTRLQIKHKFNQNVSKQLYIYTI